MKRLNRYIVLTMVALVAIARPLSADIDGQAARKSIRNAVKFLKSRQNKVTGSWGEYSIYPGGVSCLATLALLNAGVPSKDASIQRSLNYLRRMPMPSKVYVVSLQTMVYAVAGEKQDRPLIQRNVDWLCSVQIQAGTRNKGGWSYGDPNRTNHGNGDPSNAQFAVLALHEAEQAGVKVNSRTWKLANEYWKRHQQPDGSFRYPPSGSSGSMTAAGAASLIITSGKVGASDAKVVGNQVQCCGAQSNSDEVERAISWLGRKFSVTQNPGRPGAWLLYYLYAVERVGRLSGRRFLGTRDWFREGAEMLVANQDPFEFSWAGKGPVESKDRVIATSLALLFLAKGQRPVVMAQLQYGDKKSNSWNRHRSAVHNLTKHVERSWKRQLSWQTINIRAATLENLMESPVLVLSGSGPLVLSDEEKRHLQEYVNQGGFIFAERCCESEEFDRDFRALVKELFPQSPLRALPPDHAIWYAQDKIDTKDLPALYGMDACCRTSIVYSKDNLSCYWELSRGDRESNYPAEVRRRISTYLKVGGNVIAYATNRELKDKLDRPQISTSDPGLAQPKRGVLYVPKISHGGGSDDAPNALANLLKTLHSQAEVRVHTGRRLLALTDNAIQDYPVLFMHGRRSFQFSTAERKALATFVQRGGFIFADSICASKEFSLSFRREMRTIFPDSPLARIAPGHPIFTKHYLGFELRTVTLRDPKARVADGPLEAKLRRTNPLLEGITIRDRIGVIFSPYDLSCGLENQSSMECKGYIKTDAAKLGVNILLFGLRQ